MLVSVRVVNLGLQWVTFGPGWFRRKSTRVLTRFSNFCCNVAYNTTCLTVLLVIFVNVKTFSLFLELYDVSCAQSVALQPVGWSAGFQL